MNKYVAKMKTTLKKLKVKTNKKIALLNLIFQVIYF